MNMNVFPLVMTPAFRHGSQTPWGGHALKELFGKDTPEDITGESLEVSALPGLESRVSGGEYAGKTLREMHSLWGKSLTGLEGNDFPLLLKFLDTRQPLSVQVHPDDSYALSHEGKLGKSEAWYILDAAPGAELVYGINTRLRDVSDRLKKLREKPDKQIKELRAIWINTNYPKEIREKIAEAMDIYRNMLEKSLSEFYKANNVIIWDFATMKPKDVDYEDEEENDD